MLGVFFVGNGSWSYQNIKSQMITQNQDYEIIKL